MGKKVRKNLMFKDIVRGSFIVTFTYFSEMNIILKKYLPDDTAHKSFEKTTVSKGRTGFFLRCLFVFGLIVIICSQCCSAAKFAPGIVRTIETFDIPTHVIIEGDNIVWTKYKAVMLHNLVNNKSLKISRGNYFELFTPEISGDYIIWTEMEDKNANLQTWDLYLYRISTGEIVLIPTGNGAPRYHCISGNYIVWKESDAIFLYNITEQSTEKISEAVFTGYCGIEGDTVVWEGYTNPDSRTTSLYVYNITTKKINIISNLPGFRDGFLLCGGKIIWADWLTNTSVSIIREYSLNNEELSEITRVKDQAGGFSMSGDLFVYTNFGFWSTDTPDSQNHLINLTTNEDMLLTPAEHGYRGASVSGNKIIWPDGNVILFTYDPSGEPLRIESVFGDIPHLKDVPGFGYIAAIMALMAVFTLGRAGK